MKTWILSLLACALVFNCASPEVLAQESSANENAKDKVKDAIAHPVRDKWALVVGISKFKHKDIPELQFSAKDAADFYRYLIEEANFRKDHVRVLLNEEATERAILSNLCEDFLPNLVQPNDLVVVYFSTHGSPSQVNLRGEGKNYLVAYDSNPKKLLTTGIEMKEMLRTIGGQVNSKRILLVLDACHSGTLDPNAKGLKRVANFDTAAIGQGTGQLVICSSQPDEQSWESKRYKNGVFTKQLLEGMRTKDNNGLKDTFMEIKNRVFTEVKQDRLGARQTPVLNSKWKGEDLILAAKPAVSQPVPETVVEQLGADSSERLSEYMKHDPDEDNLKFDEVLKEPITTEEEVSESEDGAPPAKLVVNKAYFKEIMGDEPPKQLFKAFTGAIRRDPKNPDHFYGRALVNIHFEKWLNAFNDLSDALMNNPNDARYYIARAYVNHRRKQPVDANSDLKNAKFYDRKLPKDIVLAED